MGLFRLGWLKRLVRGRGEILYVDPMQGETSFDELLIQAKLENRQRDLAKKLKAEGKSVLMGYQVPEPYVEDRISVHAARQGWIPPTEARRRQSWSIAHQLLPGEVRVIEIKSKG